MVVERIVYILDDDAAVRRSLGRLLDSADTIPSLCHAERVSHCCREPAGRVCVGGSAHAENGRPGGAGAASGGQRRASSRYDDRTRRCGKRGERHESRGLDFIEKPFSDEVLLGAVELALKEKTLQLRSNAIMAAAALVGTLSTREREVLDALVAGQPNKVIAYDLGISVRTVEVHRARMMDRLGVAQFAEAVRIGVLAQLARGN